MINAQWVPKHDPTNCNIVTRQKPVGKKRFVHSLQKISGRFADFLYKTAFLKSKFEDDPVGVQ